MQGINMIPDFLFTLPLADITYSFTEAHLPGKVVIGVLMIFSIFAWTVMFTKFGEISRTRRLNKQFLEAFRSEKSAFDLFTQRVRVEGCSLYEIYNAGCKELKYYHGIQSDPTAAMGLLASAGGKRVTLKQMDHVKGVIERTVAEQGLKLEQGLVMLATAVSGAPLYSTLARVMMFSSSRTFPGQA